MRNARTPPAFALLELLVVIAIIAILATLVLTVVGRARSKARSIQCQNNIRQTLLALQMYADDFDALLSRQAGPHWPVALAPYVSINPAAVGGGSVISRSKHIWYCPGDRGLWSDWVTYTQAAQSYGFNGAGTGLLPGTVEPLGLTTRETGSYKPIRPSAIVSPSDMIVFGDAYASTVAGVITRRHGVGLIGVNKGTTGNDYYPYLKYHKHGQLNVGFIDGHTLGETYQKLLLEKSEASWRRWNRDNQAHFDAAPIEEH